MRATPHAHHERARHQPLTHVRVASVTWRQRGCAAASQIAPRSRPDHTQARSARSHRQQQQQRQQQGSTPGNAPQPAGRGRHRHRHTHSVTHVHTAVLSATHTHSVHSELFGWRAAAWRRQRRPRPRWRASWRSSPTACGRLNKELDYYRRELAAEQARVEAVRAAGADTHTQRHAVREGRGAHIWGAAERG